MRAPDADFAILDAGRMNEHGYQESDRRAGGGVHKEPVAGGGRPAGRGGYQGPAGRAAGSRAGRLCFPLLPPGQAPADGPAEDC